ncbi:recombinase family protein [Jatrophihabitans sp. DSM 45814]
MPADRARAALYARLSKDANNDRAGVDRQLDDARQLAKLRDLRVVAEHVDNDLSAAGTKSRPGFEAMLKQVIDGEVDVIVAWAWDRLSRNRRDTLRLIEAGQEARTTVALVRGSDIDMSTASGRLVADLLAGVSRAEIDAKSERQRRAGLQRAEAGKPPARRAFGYLQNGDPHPSEAAVVRAIYAGFLAGATIIGTAKQLNADGHRTARGNLWDDGAVRVVLTNPRYISERYYRGERVGVGEWEPLVSVETFAAVHSKLNDPGRKVRREARKYLGSGLFECWCGSKAKTSYTGTGMRVYVCRARAHMQRNAEPTEEVVYRVVAERLRRADVRDLLQASKAVADVGALRQEQVGLLARLDGLADDYATGLLNGRQVQVATQRIEADLAAVESKLAAAGKGSALAAVVTATDPGAAWLALALDRQRAVLADLVKVVIDKGRVGRGAFDPETIRFDWT